MKRSFIIIALGFAVMAFSPSLQAQKSERKAAAKEMRQEMRSYVETHVVPVMKPQREKLDQYLSSSEKQEIEDIRASLKAHKEDMRSQGKELRKLHKSGEEPTEAQKESMRAMHKEMRLLMNRAWVIVDAHETEIYALLDETEAEQKQWREDLRSMVKAHKEAFKPEGQEGRGEGKGHHGKMKRKGGKGHMGGRGMMRGAEFLKPVGFLLWDGTLPEPRNFDQEFQGLNSADELKVFPNPASQANNLSFAVKKAGSVTVVLIDETGQKIQTLLNEQLDAGTYTKQFSLGDLAPGVYYYQINAPGERSVKRFLIEE